MLFRVLKEFRGNGATHLRGAEVDFEPGAKVTGLIAQRYLLPIDPKVADATQAPAVAIAEKQELKKARGRPRSVPTPNAEG